MQIRHNYLYLFVGLLFVLLGRALGDQLVDVQRVLVLDGTLALAFVFGVWTLVRSRKAFIAGCSIGVAFIALDVAANIHQSAPLFNLTLLCVLMFFLLSSFIAIYDVLFGGKVDLNRILGAVCIYLMSGTIWGIVYYFLHFYSAGAFAGVDAGSAETPLGELIYYSFVTLTTLGFGDITPVSPLAKTLSYLEAVLGQIYLTVLVAALVGVHIATLRPTPVAGTEAGTP